MEGLQTHINEEVEQTLTAHTESLKVANHEMGLVHERLSMVEVNVGWVKNLLEKVDLRVWVVLTGIIVVILTQIAFFLVK